MYSEPFIERLTVLAFAAYTAVNFALRGAGERASAPRALARGGVAVVALVCAALVALRIAPPVVAYGVLCLAAVSIFVIDVLGEERARRRRVASLAPRLAVAVVPTIWIASAAAAALLTIPYVVLAEERAAAAIVGICSLVMAYIAWRIASAPVQLAGEDIAAERGRDRAIRLRRVGLTTVVAIGNVFVFTSFVNAELPFVTTAQRAVHMTSLAAWVALWAWQAWYVRRLGRGSYAACA